jgi:hypothetical protein
MTSLEIDHRPFCVIVDMDGTLAHPDADPLRTLRAKE